MNTRKIEEKIFVLIMALSTGVVLCSLLLLLWTVFTKGFSSLTIEMITQAPKGGYYLGKAGGILNAILGSLYLAGGAVVLALVLSLPIAIYLNMYLKKKSRFAEATRFSLDVLLGVPSIVYGAFGFSLMILLGLKTSLLAGIITVALLILPMMIRSMDEGFKMIPCEIIVASLALGATRLETALKVVVRQGLPVILTAVLIAFGRAIGDAASVLFTAGFTDQIPTSLTRPAATLPLAIFFQLGTPFPEVQQRGYAAALLLTAIVLVVSLLTRAITKRFTKNVIR
ncbi:MAG: phosphate ABC transporter, permease protein PstA [Elusimicrobia bacterium RIFOXYB2_FULL_49_7]|nr:MAG: phosphate ABC transporter, permease protein PstA [Elusimicrobia bacterium RIFOXYB2_FULL_49_7]